MRLRPPRLLAGLFAPARGRHARGVPVPVAVLAPPEAHEPEVSSGPELATPPAEAGWVPVPVPAPRVGLAFSDGEEIRLAEDSPYSGALVTGATAMLNPEGSTASAVRR